NNLPILNERQANKLFGGTIGELLVLVERKLSNVDEEDDLIDRPILKVVDLKNGFLNIDYDLDRPATLSALNPHQKSRSETDLTHLGEDLTEEKRTGETKGMNDDVILL